MLGLELMTLLMVGAIVAGGCTGYIITCIAFDQLPELGEDYLR